MTGDVELPRSLSPLRHRPFALLWSGAFVSNIGTWMETVGVGILVTETTGQAAWTGLVFAAGFVPTAVLGPLGGALADRLPRKRLLVATSSVQMVMAALLTALAAIHRAHPGSVALIVLASGCAMALGFPAYQAMLPDLVPPAEILGAVALSSAQWNLGRIIGPALAGVVIGIGGYAWAFGFNALSFLAVILVVASLHLPRPAPHGGESVLVSIRAGLGTARREPGIRVVLGYTVANAFLVAPFIALVAPMALEVLDAGRSGVSVLITAQGIGAVAMAFSLAPLADRFGPRRVMVTSLAAAPVALAGYAAAPGLAPAAALLCVVGFFYLGAFSSFSSIIQLRAPAAVRGRVMSIMMVALGLLYPVGSILQGRLADHFGLRVVTAGSAAAMLAVMAAAAARRRGLARAVEGPVDATAPGGPGLQLRVEP